jgi:hypothetical protein
MFEEEKGKGWHGDPQGHSEAAQGQNPKQDEESLSSEYFSEIGRTEDTSKEKDSDFANDLKEATGLGKSDDSD